MANQTSYSALVINSTQYQSVSSLIPLTFVTSAEAARSALQDRRKRFAAIFIDPVLPPRGGVQLIALAHRCRPATPVFVLYSDAEPFSKIEMDRLAIQGAIQLPLSSHQIREKVSTEIFDFYFDAVAPTAELVHDVASADDSKYLPVPASDFLVGTPSVYDVYVRLPSGRYFKLLSAKDTFAPNRVISYLEKGVTHFYIRRASHERCLAYCDILAQFLITHSHVSFETKLADVFSRGDLAIQAIRRQGLTPEHVEFVMAYVANIRSILNQMDLKKQEHIREFLSNLPHYDRAVSTAMVAGLLALPLKVESESAFRAIGIAALLHDLALYQMPENVQSEDETRMSEEDRTLYHQHPVLSAKLLENLPEIDPVTIQAVAQHHERRNKKGFPFRLSTEINRVAELVGISDEFVRLLLQSRENRQINVLQQMEQSVFDGFSFPVIESFRSLFMKS